MDNHLLFKGAFPACHRAQNFQGHRSCFCHFFQLLKVRETFVSFKCFNNYFSIAAETTSSSQFLPAETSPLPIFFDCFTNQKLSPPVFKKMRCKHIRPTPHKDDTYSVTSSSSFFFQKKAPTPANSAVKPSPAQSQGLKLSPVCGS